MRVMCTPFAFERCASPPGQDARLEQSFVVLARRVMPED
ncbi:hypothetical protein D187_006409 [Cystobacter fuscus DSM 2262]|uniref:Uncharacterized protein n=1 Tax=Cystobacter fuscus (strain ATCC 25194 / DSM 2262 / NBRC 100088 / M29) TaxID=1242864 RepID=S9QNW3_CYSF2|nr:hypothetical protein D187_006409 [Cystobacter fuscus DSM 2262]